MPDVSVPLRPVRVPRPLRGADGVLAGTDIEPASARDAALTDQLQVTGVTHASGQVEPGDLYAALPGERTHGARFAAQAAAVAPSPC